MKIDITLTERIAASRDATERFAVIVTLHRADDLARLQARGITPDLVFESIAAFSARLTAADISALASGPEVHLIEADQQARAISPPR